MSCHIAGKQVESGQKLFTSITIKCRHDTVEIPLFIAAGKNEGPLLFLISGEHGTELTGPESIRRFITAIDPQTLTGNIVAIPVANPLAMRSKQHSYPYDKWAWFSQLNNMSSAWPGDPNGTIDQRITDYLYREIMSKADAMASLHNTNFTHYMGYCTGSQTGKQLCLDFGRISFIREQDRPGGAAKIANRDFNIPAILIEWAPLRHLNQAAVEQTVIGLNNILISLNMTAGSLRKITDQFLLNKDFQHSEQFAQEDGVLVREVPWGAHVKKGDTIARLYDFYTYQQAQCVTADQDGILLYTGPHPSHLETFFSHTDSVCQGELIAAIYTYDQHITNDNGDPWQQLLIL